MNRYQVDYKIPGKYGYKYIVLADFHGVFNMKMANSIQAMDIKYIIIAGDLLNGYEWTNKKKIKELREFLNVISRGHTVIVCLGKTNLCRE